jgi:hypothetical protein
MPRAYRQSNETVVQPACALAARCGEGPWASEMLVQEAEQGSTIIGCRREHHALLDYAWSGYVLQDITPPMFCVRLCSGRVLGAVFLLLRLALGR